MMGFDVDDHHEPNSTPRLTLSKPPCRKPTMMTRHPPQMQTPPLRPTVSIPFRWEEAPGKPRAGGAAPPRPPPENAVGKWLELPPRLTVLSIDDARIAETPSPTTVLDGPYVGRSLSLACTFSFRRGLASGRGEGPRPAKRKFGSGRWGGKDADDGKFGRGDLDFSHSLGEIFRSEKNVKITRVRKRRGFFRFSGISSNLWGDIYASLKQAVPWRRAQPMNAKKDYYC